MKLVDLLDIDRVLIDPDIASKKRVLETASQLIADTTHSVTRSDVFDSLISRERLGSTGLGKGIALPHGRVNKADKAYAAFMRLGTPINYDALDGGPVDLIFALVIPEGGNENHLQVLAQLAEMFSEKNVAEALRAATTAKDLWEIISGWAPHAQTA